MKTSLWLKGCLPTWYILAAFLTSIAKPTQAWVNYKNWFTELAGRDELIKELSADLSESDKKNLFFHTTNKFTLHLMLEVVTICVDKAFLRVIKGEDQSPELLKGMELMLENATPQKTNRPTLVDIENVQFILQDKSTTIVWKAKQGGSFSTVDVGIVGDVIGPLLAANMATCQINVQWPLKPGGEIIDFDFAMPENMSLLMRRWSLAMGWHLHQQDDTWPQKPLFPPTHVWTTDPRYNGIVVLSGRGEDDSPIWGVMIGDSHYRQHMHVTTAADPLEAIKVFLE
eukprot:GHVS01000804.1.p1 GENE.GHVS01000804.1~~GHVS01000804.1.p1  ORF type:complete len:285 (+),score=30.20 GHVS01000804.1:233-1087(+)